MNDQPERRGDTMDMNPTTPIPRARAWARVGDTVLYHLEGSYEGIVAPAIVTMTEETGLDAGWEQSSDGDVSLVLHNRPSSMSPDGRVHVQPIVPRPEAGRVHLCVLIPGERAGSMPLVNVAQGDKPGTWCRL